jgi:hypothetical protein
MHTNQCLTRITRANRANTHALLPRARATHPLPVTYKYTEVIFETPFYCYTQRQPMQEMLQSITTSMTISIKICYNM